MKILKDYGLSIALFLLFFFSWFGQGVFQWREFVAEQEEHKQPVQVSQYFDSFMQATFENWQSEFLQLFSFVVLATYLIHKGSPQSKDGDDEMKKMLQDIQKKLDKKPKRS
jgi:hypothetical protein